ncbi:MAG: FAD-binding protein [Acidimicrobiales bacterium]|jgi:glycolate oxidase|nr:FAD-binding oxidoreductase [Actinomycetota bacterium]MCH2628486.1 FAD-binding protein [Acidimicrobiales bacterium]MEC9114368.1 FAD-linked oxidase C-terminal domain-containing protein [Actinomycetota bacterium]|tara:strand:- start:8953 stop:10392 length:1440 start_codon:yes stop_codon:yes gene_type:complete
MVHKSADEKLLSDLRSFLGDRARDGDFELGLYSKDGSVLKGDPMIVCLPIDTEEVQQIVLACRKHDRPFLARGSGTGLAGGAVPVGDPVVIATAKMNKILDVDIDNRIAWVEPGVLNLDLSRELSPLGFHFAPDPSSQQVCSIGGNVANNSGGPHCLAYGVTSAHVAAVEVVLPDGRVTLLGDLTPESPGYDLRGLFIGSEGTMGIATKVAVRLTPNPPEVRTLLLDFADVRDGAAAVSSIIAAGLIPAALEMMDQRAIEIVEAFVNAGYPTEADAVLLVELDGLPGGVEHGVEVVRAVAEHHQVGSVRVAADDAERALLWKGRKNAFGAVARIKPDYYLHDTVVPRGKLVEVLEKVYQIADAYDLIAVNVFHAGDGNLHPILAYDADEKGVLERVQAAGRAIVTASIEAGGVLSGEHGIGLEKRDYMGMLFSAHDMATQDLVREALDPDGFANPLKVLPSGSRCSDSFGQHVPDGAWV